MNTANQTQDLLTFNPSLSLEGLFIYYNSDGKVLASSAGKTISTCIGVGVIREVTSYGARVLLDDGDTYQLEWCDLHLRS
jgi:hypothetical protein